MAFAAARAVMKQLHFVLHGTMLEHRGAAETVIDAEAAASIGACAAFW
jgi:hypothetical protein